MDESHDLPPRVTQAIGPVAKLADAYNKLRDYVLGARGASGIVIKHSAGGAVHQLRTTAIPGNQSIMNIGGTGGGGRGASNQLHYLDATTQIDIDGNGIKLTNLSSHNIFSVDTTGTVYVTNGSTGATLTINPALITHSMGIKTISVCSGGSTMSMDLIASDPYT